MKMKGIMVGSNMTEQQHIQPPDLTPCDFSIFGYLKDNGPYHDSVIKVALTRVVIKVNIKRYRFMQ
jgi:hypothetical protein